jgi:hypothetical protein
LRGGKKNKVHSLSGTDTLCSDTCVGRTSIDTKPSDAEEGESKMLQAKKSLFLVPFGERCDAAYGDAVKGSPRRT